ncbi:MAG: hypothetical protein AVDCRST_MAG11-1763, partial [uncultured Gemmatimonadaceae bacterium]
MRSTMALVAVFISACGGSPADPRQEGERPNPDPTAVDGGEWGLRATMLENNSEFALAEANGRLYVLGGYPPSRQTARTVQ